MSVAHSYMSDPDSDLPSRPEENLRDSSLPEEGAMCTAFTDEASDDGKCDSTWPDSTSGQVDPNNCLITNEMLEEEKRLYDLGVEQEEKRTKSNTEILNSLPDEAQESHYERLKYLLNKSTMYTEYLVDRIKKQREEEEKRKARIQTRKLHLEQDEKDKASSETGNGQKQNTGDEQNNGEKTEAPAGEVNDKGEGQEIHRRACRTRGSNKRKVDEMQKPVVFPEPKTKRQKKKLSPPAETTTSVMNGTKVVEDTSPSPSSEAQKCHEVLGADFSVDEPELIEKAKIFGVADAGDERCFINGEEVSFLQPKLMDGGVLRNYQLEGYSWLKVLYENGVNGILADEMGLGKTVQCVAILSHLVYMGIPGPFLVCAPLSTIPNWFSEFQRFAPKVPTILYHGQKNNRIHLAKQIRKKHKIREGVFVQPVVITSYEVAMIDRKYLANHAWKYLIVDEGHRIKNTHCRLIRELRMYNSMHRLLLTGTPLQNSLAELWSLLNFLLPEIFNDLGSFEAWFDVNCINDADAEEKILQQERGKNILSMLHQILAPFMLRRLKSDVDLNIPPKKEILVFAPMTQHQMEFYSSLVDRTIFNLIDKKNKVDDVVETTASGRPKRRSSSNMLDYSMLMETEADKKSNKAQKVLPSRRRWRSVEQEEKELESWVQAMCDNKTPKVGEEKKQRTSQVTIKMRNVMMQLRKCCNHPYLLEHPLDAKTGDLALSEGVVSSSGKMLVLDKMLAELKRRGHRVLIFSQMTRMLDLIEDFCQIRKYDFCRLDGSTHVDDRRDSMNVFNTKNSDKFLFLLSTRAGGLGINLTGADTVIIYDSDWNPQCDLQAQDRCHRIGQTKPVVIYRFVTANTIDQKIIERAAAKRKLEKMIIHKSKFKSGNFMTKAKPISTEELQELLRSRDHQSEAIGNTFAISKSEMNSLLDRSDLFDKWNKSKESSHDQCKKEVEEDRGAPAKSKTAANKRDFVKGNRKLTTPSQFKLFKVLEADRDLDSSSATCQEPDNNSL